MPKGTVSARHQKQIGWTVARIIQGRHKGRLISENTVAAQCLGKNIGFRNQVIRELLACGYQVQEDAPGKPGGNVRRFKAKVPVAGVANPAHAANPEHGDYATLLRFVPAEAVLQAVCAHFRVTQKWLRTRRNRVKIPVQVAVFLLAHDTSELSTALALVLNLEDHEFEAARSAMIKRVSQDRNFRARLETIRANLFKDVLPRSLERTYGGAKEAHQLRA